MLEVTYNTETKQLASWNGDPEQFQNQQCEGYTVLILNTPVPDKPIEAYLFDEATQALIDNPNYIEPTPPPSYQTFTHGLPDRVKAIEGFLTMLYP